MKKSHNILRIAKIADLLNVSRVAIWRVQKRGELPSHIEIVNDDQKYTQLQRTSLSFKEKPKTRMQVARETGISRANICWYVADLLKAKKIAVIKIDRCPITRYKAQFLSTDKDLIKEKMQKQPTLFNVIGPVYHSPSCKSLKSQFQW